MEYVINPMWFYCVDVLDAIRLFAEIIVFAGTMTLFVALIVVSSVPEYKKCKAIKILSIGLAIAISLVIFIPTSSTMMKMLIAKQVTYSRVEQTKEVVEKVYDDILNVLENKVKK